MRRSLDWKPLPMNVWIFRAAGGFVKARVQLSRHDQKKFIAMVNGELVGGPDKNFDSAEDAKLAAADYIVTATTTLAQLFYNMTEPPKMERI